LLDDKIECGLAPFELVDQDENFENKKRKSLTNSQKPNHSSYASDSLSDVVMVEPIEFNDFKSLDR